MSELLDSRSKNKFEKIARHPATWFAVLGATLLGLAIDTSYNTEDSFGSSPELQAALDQDGAYILPEGVDCPDGGSELRQKVIAQAYRDPNDSDSALLAIAAEQVYVGRESDGVGQVVFCGPDFGDNGTRFAGNALIPYSKDSDNSTIIALE